MDQSRRFSGSPVIFELRELPADPNREVASFKEEKMSAIEELAILFFILVGFLVSEPIMMVTTGPAIGFLAILVALAAVIMKAFGKKAGYWVLITIWFLVSLTAGIVFLGISFWAIVVLIIWHAFLGAVIVLIGLQP